MSTPWDSSVKIAGNVLTEVLVKDACLGGGRRLAAGGVAAGCRGPPEMRAGTNDIKELDELQTSLYQADQRYRAMPPHRHNQDKSVVSCRVKSRVVWIVFLVCKNAGAITAD
jgi:hypothetical protein